MDHVPLGKDFSTGFLIGLAIVFVVHFVKGIKELRDPSYEEDERQELISQRAGELTLKIFGVVLCLISGYYLIMGRTFAPSIIHYNFWLLAILGGTRALAQALLERKH